MARTTDSIAGRVGPAVRAALATAAGLAVVQAGPGITALGPVRRLVFPRLAGRGAAGHVALTFDDGPDPAATPHFLDVLDSRGVQATFFLLGSGLRASGPRCAPAAPGRVRPARSPRRPPGSPLNHPPPPLPPPPPPPNLTPPPPARP